MKKNEKRGNMENFIIFTVFVVITVILVKIIAFLSGEVANNYLNKIKENKKQRIAWLIFYTEIKTILGIVFGICGLVMLKGVAFYIQIIYIIFLFILFLTTQKRTELGYKLIFVSIALDVFFYSLIILSQNIGICNTTRDIICLYGIIISIVSFSWGLLNFIYFMKRKNLFFRENENNSEDYEYINNSEESNKKSSIFIIVGKNMKNILHFIINGIATLLLYIVQFGGLALYVYTIVVSFAMHGIIAAILTLCLPVLSQIFYTIVSINVAGTFINSYSIYVYGYIVAFIFMCLFYWLTGIIEEKDTVMQ
jgi:hypothetical protein